MQTHEDTLELVSTVLKQSCGLDVRTVDGGFDEPLGSLGLDSLGVLELQMRISERCHVELPDDVVDMTVNDVARVLEEDR